MRENLIVNADLGPLSPKLSFEGSCMTVIDRAKCIGNMVNLGVDVGSVVEFSKRWEMNADSRLQREAFQKIVTNNQQDIGARPGLYLSWHYGMYSSILYKLAEQNALKTVYVLIGEQPDAHAKMLKSLAGEVGFNIEFIDMGSKSLRKARELIKEGQSVFMMIDVPWAHERKPLDAKYEGMGGSFLGYLGLPRLAELIDKDFRFVYLENSHCDFQIIEKSSLDFRSIYDIISNILTSNPEFYERLNEFGEYFEFKNDINIASIFTFNDQLFVYFVNSNSVFKIDGKVNIDAIFDKDCVCNSSRFTDFISDCTNEKIDLIFKID